VLLIAHRACPLDARENSIAGILAAAAAGADAVEVDVRCTRDGVAVLFHDRTAWRTARWPLPVEVTTHARLARAAAVRDGLDTLTGALTRCPASLRPTLDIKTDRAVEPTLAAVNGSGRRDVMLWHRNPAAVRRLREAAPWAETALLRNTRHERDTFRYIDDAAAAGASAVSLHQRAATPRTVARARDRGLLAYVWIVAEAAHTRVLALDPDGINTDWVPSARALIDRR
jgi:glycerophosphoryl diester phosphodiesterase